jgi:hypothetical protein
MAMVIVMAMTMVMVIVMAMAMVMVVVTVMAMLHHPPRGATNSRLVFRCRLLPQ